MSMVVLGGLFTGVGWLVFWVVCVGSFALSDVCGVSWCCCLC